MSVIRRGFRALQRAIRTEGIRGVIPTLQVGLAGIGNHRQREEQLCWRMEEENAYPVWLNAQQADEQAIGEQARTRFSHRLSFLIPCWNTKPAYLNALADSLMAQTCSQWEACLMDGGSTDKETIAALQQLKQRDPRFRVFRSEENGGISHNTNLAASHAEGDFFALCDHDDLLSNEAVYWVLQAAEQGADFIYSDEDKCDEGGTRFFDPHLKPDFSPDSLRSGNYICHLMAMSASLFHRLGGLRSRCDGSQDHDLALRASEAASHIAHIRRVLYHWRMVDSSFSHSRAERCAEAARLAVADQMERLGICAEVRLHRMTVRTVYPLPDECASYTLIVHSLEKGWQVWLRRLMKHAGIAPGQVIAVTGEAAAPGLETALSLDEASERAACPILLFAAQGVRPMAENWALELCSQAARREIACAGAPLVDAHRCYLEAGYALTPQGVLPLHQGEYSLGRTIQLSDRIVRNVTAVSPALMAIRRERLLQLGGFGEGGITEQGLRIGAAAVSAGFYNLCTPFAMGKMKKAAALQQPVDQALCAALWQSVGERFGCGLAAMRQLRAEYNKESRNGG